MTLATSLAVTLAVCSVDGVIISGTGCRVGMAVNVVVLEIGSSSAICVVLATVGIACSVAAHAAVSLLDAALLVNAISLTVASLTVVAASFWASSCAPMMVANRLPVIMVVLSSPNAYFDLGALDWGG